MNLEHLFLQVRLCLGSVIFKQSPHDFLMKCRKLGSTLFETSKVGFGAWAVGGSRDAQDDSDSPQTLHTAVDAGINLIDTAAGYGDGHSRT